MKKTFKRLSAFFAITLSLFFGLPVSAVNGDKLPDTYISMSPTSAVTVLNPGDTYSNSFIVANIGAKGFDFKVTAKPLSVSGKEYSLDYETEGKYTEISKWVTFDRTEAHLEPNETTRLYYTVKVPTSVTPGGQYVALTATTTGDGDVAIAQGANMTVGRSVASLLYVTVSGDLIHSGEIIENKIPTFFFTPPINVNSLVSNHGNVHEEALYSLEVRNLFDNEVVFTNEENPISHYIFPESERYETIPWENSPQLGIFKVKQTIKYLGQTSVEEKIVFICPLWLIFLVIFMIFLAYFYIRTKVKERKKKKEEANTEA